MDQATLRNAITQVAVRLNLPVSSVRAAYESEDGSEWQWGIRITYRCKDKGARRKKFVPFMLCEYAASIEEAAVAAIERFQRQEAALFDIER